MQCCNHNHNENEYDYGRDQNKSKQHSPLGHVLMMILCCGLPILLLWLLPTIISVFPAAAGLGAIIPLLCPIMMIPMMFMMFKGNGQSHGGCGHGETKDIQAAEKDGSEEKVNL